MRRHPSMSLALAWAAISASFVAVQPDAKAETSSVLFVGCASDGQLGVRRAPHGKAKTVSLSAKLASQLAYYQAEEGPGVLAPRGWHCFSTYGSNGSSLFVAPQPIDRKLVFSDTGKGFAGLAVQLSESEGGTSGRFEVASIIARVFPSHKAFTAKVIAEGIRTAADFPFGPYLHDKLRYRSEEVVEYETPPQTEGLGTRSLLGKSDVAIKGVEMLSGADVDLTSLAVRLPQGFEGLTQAIMQQVEYEVTVNSTR